MKAFKFYIGTEVGQVAKGTSFANWKFTKAEIVDAIERLRITYNEAVEQFPTPKIEGYSLYTIDGYWQGVHETSHVLEIMADSMDYEAFGNAIREELHQDSVMVTVQDLEVKFL